MLKVLVAPPPDFQPEADVVVLTGVYAIVMFRDDGAMWHYDGKDPLSGVTSPKPAVLPRAMYMDLRDLDDRDVFALTGLPLGPGLELIRRLVEACAHTTAYL